jgi:hypothetical protein
MYALLDALVPRANAVHISGGICDDEAPADMVIRIQQDGTVEIAAITDELLTQVHCGATTTINADNSIDNVSLLFSAVEFLDLSNMVASTTGVSGNWVTRVNNSVQCSGTFSALPGGTFPNTNFNCTSN